MLDEEQLLAAVPYALDSVDLALPGLGPKISGKVRDIYPIGGRNDVASGDERVLITTDRVSAFDRILGLVPYKGQVLNQLSAWWFEQTLDLVANHVAALPDPNVTIARTAQPLPVEVIVRGYITGVTKTSLWYFYEQGERAPYGVSLPDGLRKNDPLPTAMLTPTTKGEAGAHDERLTREQIVSGGLLDEALWSEVERVALALFTRGQEVAARAGLILVDTKYEFGVRDGELLLIDEVHTPDSSRYWVRDSYEANHDAPEHLDKEYLRMEYARKGYRGDGTPPQLEPAFAARLAARYIDAYERLTSQTFHPGAQPASTRIASAVGNYLTEARARR